MDIIAQAVHKREQLLAELRRLDQFLAVAYELQGGDRGPKSLHSEAYNAAMLSSVAAPSYHAGNALPTATREAHRRAPSGVGAETARVAAKIIREASRPIATRDLLPLVEAHGIEIGGKDPVATLSARLGNDAKRDDGNLRLRAGKWHLLEWISDADNKEATDTPGKDASAASFFSNQEV